MSAVFKPTLCLCISLLVFFPVFNALITLSPIRVNRWSMILQVVMNYEL